MVIAFDPHSWGRGDVRRLTTADVPSAVIDLILERDGTGCMDCHYYGLVTPLTEPLEIDHKQPLSRGGDNHWSNLQFLCRSHNRGRGNRNPGQTSTAHDPAWRRR